MDQELGDIPVATPAEVALPAEPARRRRPRRSLLVLGTAALVALTVGASVAVAASPGTGASPSTSPAPLDPATVNDAFKQYAACMRDHGIDMPDPVTITSSATGPVSAGGAPAGPIGGLVVGTGTAVTVGTPASAQSADAFAAADKACAPILEAAGIKTATSGTIDVTGAAGTIVSGGAVASGAGMVVAGNGDVTTMAADMKAYAACMRTHGVDVPDPVVDAKAGSVGLQVAADPSTTAFRAADAACSTNGIGFPAPIAPAATAAP